MVWVTTIANMGLFWVAIAIIGLFVGHRRPAAWRLLLALVCAYLVADVALKPLIGRARPFEVLPGLTTLIAPPHSPSFPSGHAARAFAGAVAGVAVFPGAGWVLWPFAVLVAASRVYVGVHWPSDVVAGALIGWACGWFVLGGRSLSLPRWSRSTTDGR